MNTSGIGAAVKRTEDYRFLTGGGRYTDDIKLPRQCYAYMLRSPYSHARILSIDTDAARTTEGVLAVFTGDDMQVGSLPCGWLVKSKDGQPMKEPPHMPLARDKVRHVGDQVAVVVAQSLALAKSAAELIEVEYEPLAAVAENLRQRARLARARLGRSRDLAHALARIAFCAKACAPQNGRMGAATGVWVVLPTPCRAQFRFDRSLPREDSASPRGFD